MPVADKSHCGVTTALDVRQTCLGLKQRSKLSIFQILCTFTSGVRSVQRIRIRPALRSKRCTNCGAIICPPFGLVPSCMGVYLSKLSTTLGVIESLAPGCSALCFQHCSFNDWEANMLNTFNQASSVLTDASYHAYSSHLTSITLCMKHLEGSLPLRRQISSCLAHHQPTATTEVHKLLNNLEQLFEVLQSMRSGIQQRFWDMLDSDVQASAGKLRRIMASVSPFLCVNAFSFLNLGQFASKKRDEAMVKHISWRHFANLGVSRWLDDELINHFVEKWSHQSTVLGLSSFFSVKFLFETENCETAIDLSVVVSDERFQRNLLKWIQSCQVKLSAPLPFVKLAHLFLEGSKSR